MTVEIIILFGGAMTSWKSLVKNEEYYRESRRTGTSYIHSNEGRLTGLVRACVGTVF